MWVVFDDAPLPGATPLSLYGHGQWDARLLAARGEVICVGFEFGEHPQVLAHPGRLPAETITNWANAMRRMGHDQVLIGAAHDRTEFMSLAMALHGSRCVPLRRWISP
jgi:hypothetical protein